MGARGRWSCRVACLEGNAAQPMFGKHRRVARSIVEADGGPDDPEALRRKQSQLKSLPTPINIPYITQLRRTPEACTTELAKGRARKETWRVAITTLIG